MMSCGALALALVAAVLPADEGLPRVGVSAEVVRVDVLVTDKRGDPVRGLTAADFTLEEDGKPVPIVAFQAPGAAIEAGGASPQAPQTPQPSAPEHATVPSDAPTIVVYVDTRTLTPGGLRRVLARLPGMLQEELARGGVRVLVFLSDESGPRALTGITTDAAEVSRALAQAAKSATHGYQVSSDERTTLDLVKGVVEMSEMQGIPCDRALGEMQQVVRAHATSRSHQISETITQLRTVATALGSIPGSKSLLYLGEQLEQRPAIHLYQQLGDICPKAMERDFSLVLAPMQELDASRALQEMAARANAARVTIYPVDGAGLRTFSAGDVSQSDRRFVASPGTDQVREANVRAGPWILAQATGGFPVFDANIPTGPLRRLDADLRARYALGFTPPRAPDGRQHDLRVRVLRKGLQVRHRKSWLHADRGDEHVRRTLATLLFGYQENTLLATVDAQWAPVEEGHPPGPREVVVRIVLPLASPTTAAGTEVLAGRLRVVMAVRRTGKASSASTVETREQLVDVPPSTPPTVLVRMPPFEGAQEIAVGIEDTQGTKVCYRRLQVRP